ncbi:MAG: DUF494 family protein [Plesiomonas sp.]|uniref:DUF494 family protein n=3 Tax=Plesiomonas sp. TaxID=2486279 RepID=UPI003EE6ADA5
MFDVLMYLFETYVHTEQEMRVDQDILTDELSRAGFHQDDINKALIWLEKLAELQESDIKPYLLAPAPNTVRIYTQEEENKISLTCRGFLLFLEQIQVLDSDTREMVIDRVMEIESDELDLEDVKWVILMVLFNVPGHESAYEKMEELLFDANEGLQH